jgi:hypothetical protein
LDYQQGFRDGFMAGMAQAMSTSMTAPPSAVAIEEAPGRKPSAYNRRYSAAYRRIKKKNTLKSGKMKKGYAKPDGSLSKAGHAKIRDAAHKEAKR